MTARSVRIIGGGRAGGAVAAALAEVGWQVRPILGRAAPPDEVAAAAADVDLVLIATPDAAVGEVAAAIEPSTTAAVAHLAGSLGLDAVAPHPRAAALHPLVALPDAAVGARRLLAGCWFAVAGDRIVRQVVADLGGRAFEVADSDRAAYHAAAVVASNHLVALLGQAERIGAPAGVRLAALLDLVRSTVDNVAELGPAAALTGPAARGDEATIERHLDAIVLAEHPAYRALADEARRLAGRAQETERIGGRERTSRARPWPERPVSGASKSGNDHAVTGSADRPVTEATVRGLRARLHEARSGGRRVGLVPTMGFLHAGHRSLIELARSENDLVVVSIFVNPLQFNPGEDFDDYPRDLDHDRAVCVQAGADIVFAPGQDEMYPEPVATTVRLGTLADVLCGASRPGHFDGVATVVAKLLSIVGECSAYFGEKDFQQLTIVSRMVKDLSLPVRVVGCPTVREPDGLALSSRNAYLSEAERAQAPVLRRALEAGAALVEAGETDGAAVEAQMAAVIRGASLARIDYAAAVSPATLTRHQQPLQGDVRLLVAVRFGKARLIDNLGCRAR